MTLAELIKQKRKATGLTLEEVGDACGMSKGHLHELESGKQRNPGLYTCVKLSVVLGCSIQQMGLAVLCSNEAITASGRDAS